MRCPDIVKGHPETARGRNSRESYENLYDPTTSLPDTHTYKNKCCKALVAVTRSIHRRRAWARAEKSVLSLDDEWLGSVYLYARVTAPAGWPRLDPLREIRRIESQLFFEQTKKSWYFCGMLREAAARVKWLVYRGRRTFNFTTFLGSLHFRSFSYLIPIYAARIYNRIKVLRWQRSSFTKVLASLSR